jgi:hypothetical protein
MRPNEFHTLTLRARDNPEMPEAYRTPAFQERIKLQGEQGLKDKVSIQLSLLRHLALSPADVPAMIDELNRGCGCLKFVSYGNPVPLFSVGEGSPELTELLEAFNENLQSKRFKAAKLLHNRYLRGGRYAWIDRLASAFEASLPPLEPPASRSEQDVKAAYERLLARNDLIRGERARLTATRQVRMRAISLATSTRPFSWIELLDTVAQEVFVK